MFLIINSAASLVRCVNDATCVVLNAIVLFRVTKNVRFVASIRKSFQMIKVKESILYGGRIRKTRIRRVLSCMFGANCNAFMFGAVW